MLAGSVHPHDSLTLQGCDNRGRWRLEHLRTGADPNRLDRVSGDAGVGKGRLIYEFRSSKLLEGKKILWAVCQSDQILRRSFNPLRSWLLKYFGLFANHSLDERKRIFDAKLDEVVAVAGQGLARRVGHLAGQAESAGRIAVRAGVALHEDAVEDGVLGVVDPVLVGEVRARHAKVHAAHRHVAQRTGGTADVGRRLVGTGRQRSGA